MPRNPNYENENITKRYSVEHSSKFLQYFDRYLAFFTVLYILFTPQFLVEPWLENTAPQI
jgi:hypothetical protein